MDETREVTGPRTYQCRWRWHDDGSAVLQTAEEWLEEEADIYAKMTAGDEDEDDDNRAGIMRAIAKEIATLRRERTQWAESYTARAARSAPVPEGVGLSPEPHVAEINASIDYSLSHARERIASVVKLRAPEGVETDRIVEAFAERRYERTRCSGMLACSSCPSWADLSPADRAAWMDDSLTADLRAALSVTGRGPEERGGGNG